MFILKTKEVEPEIKEVPFEAQPFHFKAGDRAIFFIHGFTDSLCRVNGHAKKLAENGITTKGVLLPGHGKGWEDLLDTTPDDWYREVERGILELSKEAKEIYLMGISFGGNLALKFDAMHPGVVKGIVTIEAPMGIKYQSITKSAIPVARALGFKYWNKQYLKKTNHPDKDTVFRQGVMDKMPLKSIAEVIHVMEHQDYLKKVKADTLIIQSENSNLVTKDSADEIYHAISSNRKKIFRMENVYHAFLSEPAKKTIFYETCKFFGIKY